MNTLALIGGGVLVVLFLILLLTRVSREAAGEKVRLRSVMRELGSLRRFQDEISKPLVRGRDLITKLRDKLPTHKDR